MGDRIYRDNLQETSFIVELASLHLSMRASLRKCNAWLDEAGNDAITSCKDEAIGYKTTNQSTWNRRKPDSP